MIQLLKINQIKKNHEVVQLLVTPDEIRGEICATPANPRQRVEP